MIVFTAEGDLWSVGIDGGLARRLTTHHGVELHAAISPNGKRIAFSAEYEGTTDVYSMPMMGGVPSRHTYDGERNRVVGWTPDGKILYCTHHYSTLPNAQLATIHPDTGNHKVLPLSQSSDGCFTTDGQTLFFTRLAFQGSHTKRYQGGTAQNIWTYTFGEPEAVSLTSDYPGTSKAPMWWNDRVFFVSDRDGTMNLWSMDSEGKAIVQHTFHKGWDVQSPALHNGRIVYQLGADLHLYTIDAAANQRLDIYLTSDFEQTRERWVSQPIDYLTSAHLSPKGDRLALTARGRVFVAPVKQGRFVAATRDSQIRYRNARFMPDGKTVIALTDETKELEFCQIPANGVGQPEVLTQGGTVFRYSGTPSPDGAWIVFSDKDQRLWLLNVESRDSRCIAESEAWGSFFDWSWSPDSQWLAYVGFCDNQFTQIRLYSLADGTTINLTSDRVDSYNPVWSPDGKWLYFLSDRHFKSLVMSPWGPRQPEPYFDKTTKIYHVSLVSGERSPFQPLDELHQAFLEQQEAEKKQKEPDQASDAAANGTDGSDDAVVTVVIDRDGLQQRVMEMPLDARNYRNLSINKTRLFWTEAAVDAEEKQSLNALEIKDDPVEPKVVMEGVRSYELSLDGTKLLIRKDSDFYVIDADKDAPKDEELNKQRVDLSNWSFSVHPRDEWRQMLMEAWRLERDYFYDRNLHGVDWSGLLEKHLPLVERVTDRDELNDLIAQLVGELAALHTFVSAGDRRKGQDHVGLASLGATLSYTDEGYRIDYLYQHDPDYPDRAGPLTRPEVALQVGDIIQAINGVSLSTDSHPSALLKNQADQQVLLQIKPNNTEESRSVIVKPFSMEDAADLRYSDWEYCCRERVEQKGDGKLGYVHLKAMGRDNYTEWVENYYPIFNREGLIIDVRHNRGGNIDSWILEKLLRKAWFFWKPRVGKPFWNMQWAFRGHMVVLCNEHTASDGEAFTEGFRRLGLGKVIGTRTWGGEIWLSLQTWLVDHGIASAAEIGVYGPEGEWLIEGHGVEPDIIVDNLPHSTFKGDDVQLDYAISYLQDLIRHNPVPVPPPPEYPNKSFRYES